MTVSSCAVRLDAALRERLPETSLSSETGPFAIDGATPSIVLTPSSPEEVAMTLAAADEAGAAVVPWGGGTQQGLGLPPERYDLALDLRRLDRVVEYEPADLTVTVEAGIRLSELQRRLGEHGQWLPLDPPLAPDATVGGVLATNASGPVRHAYGSARDLLIGMRVATAWGDVVKSGGRVVKNVAGYDLGKLHIGALGTLGVIVQATFKVAPLPVETAIAAIDGDLRTLMSITARLVEARLALNGLVLTHDASSGGWTLLVRFAGGAAAVERSKRELASIAGTGASGLDAAEWQRRVATPLEAPVVVHGGVIPTAVAAAAEALAKHGASVVTYPTSGTLYGAWSSVEAPPLVEARRVCVETGRGALVIEKGRLALRRAAGVWGDTRGDFALMRRLKDELDPQRVLNPGRFVGGL